MSAVPPADEDYRTVARAHAPEYAGTPKTRVVRVPLRNGKSVDFGGPKPVVIAGPCAVETAEQTLSVARGCQAAGADMLRGGAYKPRTSPYSFQGLGREGLEILSHARRMTGLPVVTEVMDVRLIPLVERHADMLQVGSRNMQNYALLLEVGRTKKPVLLKRGMCATLHEWLCAAEYVAKGGNEQIVLCERGIRAVGNGEYDRNALDLNVIPAAIERTHLPVIADPSHGTGVSSMVPHACLAAVAYGAHGLIVEVIPEGKPADDAYCDGDQSIWPSTLKRIVDAIPSVATFARGERERTTAENRTCGAHS